MSTTNEEADGSPFRYLLITASSPEFEYVREGGQEPSDLTVNCRNRDLEVVAKVLSIEYVPMNPRGEQLAWLAELGDVSLRFT
jgi:hypothetical protein